MCGDRLLEVRKGRDYGEPGLVGEHMQPRRVQARDGAELGLVAPGKDDDVPAPLLDQGPLRVGRFVYPVIPVSRLVVPCVERADQGARRKLAMVNRLKNIGSNAACNSLHRLVDRVTR